MTSPCPYIQQMKIFWMNKGGCELRSLGCVSRTLSCELRMLNCGGGWRRSAVISCRLDSFDKINKNGSPALVSHVTRSYRVVYSSFHPSSRPSSTKVSPISSCKECATSREDCVALLVPADCVAGEGQMARLCRPYPLMAAGCTLHLLPIPC